MPRKTHLFEIDSRPKIRLTEVERIIRRKRIIIPPLARRTLTKMCETGIFETAGARPHPQLGWLVYEDSFRTWVEQLEKKI